MGTTGYVIVTALTLRRVLAFKLLGWNILALTVTLTESSVPLAAAQTSAPHEQGTFTLFKLQQRVGQERYEIARAGDSIVVRATATLAFLGTNAPLVATLVTDADLTPRSYEAKGMTSTFTDVDVAVGLAGDSAHVRDRVIHRTASRVEPSFTISHYAPVAMRMMALRHWLAQARPERVALLPAGEMRVALVGRDTIPIGQRRQVLDRYAVHGLTWGMQSTWLDSVGNLVALVGGDAELDRFEAIREGYETALPVFVGRAVADGIALYRRIAGELPPLRRGRYAIVGTRVIDIRGGVTVENATIVIDDGRIADAGPADRVRVPAGTATMDGRGLTALPGLWDMHGHYEQVEWPLVGLAAGITTVRDVANEFELVTALRDEIEAGRIVGPRMLLAGVVDGGERPLGVITANTPEEARAVVRRYHAARFQQIKIYESLSPALVPIIADEAHRLGMTVTGHVPSGMDAYAFIRAGADQINHLNFVTAVMRPALQAGQTPRPIDLTSAEAQAAIRFLVQHRTVLDPSLARAEEFLHPKQRYEEVEPGVGKVPIELVGALQSTGVAPEVVERAQAAQDRALAIVAALHHAGVPIVLGTDLTVPGHSIYRELELAVRGGIAPIDALRAATIVPARAMGLEREGAIVAGARADLILVEGDPLARISDIRRLRYVIARGRLFESAMLWRAAGFLP